MKKLRVTIPACPRKLTPTSRVLAVGSCFSEEMARRLNACGLPVLSNPYGTIYNPMTLAGLLRRLASGQPYGVEDLLTAGGLFFTPHHATQYSATCAKICLEKSNAAFQKAHAFAAGCDTFIITLGSAVVQALGGKAIVANCHKLAHRHFEERLLSVEECTRALVEAVQGARTLSPGAQVFVTVSPIRHYPQDLCKNTLSKALLRTSIAEAAKRISFDYFPSFEMAYDELSRERHFERDGLHLNAAGVAHVFRRFRDACFSDELQRVRARVASIRRRLRHRSADPRSEAHLGHLVKTAEELARTRSAHPDLDLSPLAWRLAASLLESHPERPETHRILEAFFGGDHLARLVDVATFLAKRGATDMTAVENPLARLLRRLAISPEALP